MRKSQALSLFIELGGHEVRVTGTATPGDPGQTSGPPERCYPPEDPEYEVEKIELVTGLAADRYGKQVYTFLDVTDLVSDLGGGGVVDDLAWRAFEQYEPEDEPLRD